MTTLSVNQLTEGQSATITQIKGDKSLAIKMLGLGLRVGSEVCVLQRRNQGFVLANHGTRIALGESLACHLSVSPSLKA